MTDRAVTPPASPSSESPDDGTPADAPLRLHQSLVLPQWVDYNGHMTESCYLLVFGDNADAFFRFLGVDDAYRDAGHSLYTVETHLHHRREVGEGEPLALSLQLLDHDHKRLHIFHEMRHGRTGDLVATAEQMLVHVDMLRGRSTELPTHLVERLDLIRASHVRLPRPDVVGRPMAIRHTHDTA